MTPNELLERRAERGTPRGAASVWAGAQHQLGEPDRSGSRASAWTLRVALAVSAASLMVLAGIRTASFERTDALIVMTPTEEDADLMSDLPAPILVTGMTLESVHEPWGTAPESGTTFEVGRTPEVASTRVYASADDPLGGPVIGIDTLVGGGFSPWSANLGEAALRSMTADVVRKGESWRLADPGALVEVDQFSDEPMTFLIDGWQLDFVDGRQTATVQAEADATIWRWMSRMLRHQSADEETTVSPVEVLGHEGVLVGDDVLWEADGFVYRVTAGEVRGDTHHGKPAEPILDRLTLVDRTEWDAAVERAQTPSFWSRASLITSLATVVVWILASLALMVRQPRRIVPIAACSLLGFVIWWAVAPSMWFAVVLLTLPAAAFLRHRSSRRQ